MDLLLSNYPPLKTSYNTFFFVFYSLLPKAKRLDIAVGYITADSLIELKKIIELNDINLVNLTIGMHYLEHFTKVQYNAAVSLNSFLSENHIGEVRLVTPFRFHGKLYSFSNDIGPYAGIIGSNNLGSIVEGGSRIYESSALFTSAQDAKTINDFIQKLVVTSTTNIKDLEIDVFNESNQLLEGHEFVQKVKPEKMAKVLASLSDIHFDIPIKGYEVSGKSNLNVFFGKGRQSPNGLVKPRHWYEVEIIVPKDVTSQPGYPQSKTETAEFNVITDDGWEFKCKVSGDYSKNFRSEGDLKILGKWLKGRLENAGVLKVGDPVTIQTLLDYGRNTFSLIKTKIENTWFLDFGVKR